MLLSMLKDRQGSGWYTATHTEGEMGWGGGGWGEAAQCYSMRQAAQYYSECDKGVYRCC